MEASSQLELRKVLENARSYASENVGHREIVEQSAPAAAGAPDAEAPAYGDEMRFRFVAGVCNQEDRR